MQNNMQMDIFTFEARALGLLPSWEKDGCVSELSGRPVYILGSTVGLQWWLLVACLLRGKTKPYERGYSYLKKKKQERFYLF